MVKCTVRWSEYKVVGLLLLMAANAAAAQGPSHLLQGIDFVAQPDDRVLLTLSLSDVAPEPRVFTVDQPARIRSEEHTSELQSLMRNSYAVFCLKKKKSRINTQYVYTNTITSHPMYRKYTRCTSTSTHSS